MTNCCCKKPTAEQAKIIEEMLAAPYPVTVSSIAGRLGVTDLEAAELLPEANCTFVKGDITERRSLHRNLGGTRFLGKDHAFHSA